MKILELRATERAERGKGPARRMRAQGLVPAVLYGEKLGSVAVSVDRRELVSAMNRGGMNAIVKLVLDGDKSQTAMIKEIQRDPLRDKLIHVDFLKIAMDEKITAHVALTITGESAGVDEGGVLQQVTREIEVEALPMDLPEHIDLDVTELNIGDSLRVQDLAAPAGVTILASPEDMVLSIIPPTQLKEEELVPAEELEEGEEVEGAEAAEEEAGEPAAEETPGE